MKTKLITLVVLFLAACTITHAQSDYSSAIGLRLGSPVSVSYKTFINDKGALEGYVGLRSFGFGNFINISGAYQVHNNIADVDGLAWYFGGGASIFIWNYDNDFVNTNFSSTAFGLQGYLGLDYKFKDAPVNLSLDWVPTFFVGGTLNINSFGGGYGALAVRYTLN